MFDAERERAGEKFGFSTGPGRFDQELPSSADQGKCDLLGRLAEQAAGLRASAMLLGDHIERLAHLATRHRLG